MDPAPKPVTRFRITRNRINLVIGLVAYLTWLAAFLYARRHGTTFEIPLVLSLAGGLGAVMCITMALLITVRKLQRAKAHPIFYVLVVAFTLVVIYYVAGFFVKPTFGP